MSPRETLVQYGAKQASTHQVMRALFGHQGWYLPVGLFGSEPEERVHEQGVIIGEGSGYPPGEKLWVFTDREAIDRAAAKGAQMGMYVGPYSGADLGRRWDPQQFSVLEVNPCSPQEERWIIGAENHFLVDMWLRTLELESHLFAGPQELAKAMGAFEGLMLWTTPDRRSLRLITINGLPGSYAAVFTAPDRRDAIAAQLPAGQEITVAALDGKSLWATLQQFGEGVAGAAINCDMAQHPVIEREKFAQMEQLSR